MPGVLYGEYLGVPDPAGIGAWGVGRGKTERVDVCLIATRHTSCRVCRFITPEPEAGHFLGGSQSGAVELET